MGDILFGSSPRGRVAALLPSAETLDDVIDVLARVQLTAREAPQVEKVVKEAARRFADELPEGSGAVYQLVAKRLPGDVASLITGYLLAGVGRRGIAG